VPRRGVEISLYSFSTSALGGGGWSAPRPGRLTPGKDPVPIVQEGGGAEPVWTCAKNLAPTGIRSPYCLARSQSLYRLSYPAHESPSARLINQLVPFYLLLLYTKHTCLERCEQKVRIIFLENFPPPLSLTLSHSSQS
jgi:hypothetical protein